MQPDRLDGEEIDREQAAPVRSHELAPGHPLARAGWSETRCPKPSADRRRRNHQAKAFQFTDDALIAPPRVLSRETEDQGSDLSTNRRAPRSPRICPSFRHQA